jgi:hypothetical protein
MEIGMVKLTKAFLLGVTANAPAAMNTCQAERKIRKFLYFTSVAVITQLWCKIALY